MNVILVATAKVKPSPWFYSTFVFHSLGAMSWMGSRPTCRSPFTPPRARGLLKLIKPHSWLWSGAQRCVWYSCLPWTLPMGSVAQIGLCFLLRIHLVSGSGFFWFRGLNIWWSLSRDKWVIEIFLWGVRQQIIWLVSLFFFFFLFFCLCSNNLKIHTHCEKNNSLKRTGEFGN